ncbi:histidine ammonia-lyase [Bartonella sp. 1-1C]|nr:histidine ammonia-lyase [Bartonella sp. 1-1C]
MMTLNLISRLGRWTLSVGLELLYLLENMLASRVISVFPEKGSVGALGNLVPLAHIASMMIGEGEAFFQNFV